MKHAKRMVLVLEDVLNRYEQKQKNETSPITANMMHQDTAMSEILQSTDISDAEKQKLYNANMESYLSNLRRQKDDQIPTVRIAQDAEQKSKEKAPLSDADVIGHLPVTLRLKAATLLRRLKARPDVISWDDSGQVKVDGKEIPDSNISDLVSDAMRARKHFNPKL
jgi:predicted class III extradiol MEMO1 family dioxygenase